MRILVLGAGATGGYYGGRLCEVGADVTFLVRPRRAQQLKQTGLIVKSQYGDLRAEPKLIEKVDAIYDVVIVSCKAFDLESAIEAIEPAVGEYSVILPLLNGMQHINRLTEGFSSDRVMGGLCQISSTLAEDGEIIHLNDQHFLKFGELNGKLSRRVQDLDQLTSRAKMKAQASETILHDMWDKWMRLATLAGITCLMRASVCDIAKSPEGNHLSLQLFHECVQVGASYGYEAREKFIEQTHKMLTDQSSTLAASMLRDIERGNNVEGDHILGNLIALAESRAIAVPLLKTAYCHIKAYEQRRARSA